MDFDWNEDKNQALKEKRGMSFERILIVLAEGTILAVLEHPNPGKHQGQWLYILEIDNYAWVVPYRNEGGKRVLITAFPSRKYTHLYLKIEG